MSGKKPSRDAKSTTHSRGSSENARERMALDVLLVEDDRTDATLMLEMLSRSRHFDFRVEHVADIDAGRQALAATHFDLMILDFWVGSESSLSLLRRSLQQTWNMPALLVSSVDVADVQGMGLEAGAYGYLHKNDLAPSTLDAVIRTLLHSRASEANLRRSLADNVRDQEGPALQGEAIATADAMHVAPPTAADPSDAERLSTLVARRLQRNADESAGGARLRLAPVDIVAILKSAAAALQEKCDEKEQKLSLVCVDREIIAEADAAATQRLIQTLVENAHLFSPRKSKIDIIARQTDGRARISVIDQGVGITRDEIVEATRRRVYPDLPKNFLESTGQIGLAVAIALVDLHDGAVEIESQLDWGTTVIVSLPLTRHRLN